MKKLLVLFVLLSTSKINSQITFCPPGAEWNYKFYNNLPYYTIHEKIKYIKDSVIGGEATKVLRHKRYYNQINDFYGDSVLTFIKQNGDTVFFKSLITQNQWQVLYNFNTPANQGWLNYISYVPSSTFTVLYSTKVDSIKTVNFNNTNLKRMYVTNIYYRDSLFNYSYPGIIDERIGFRTDFLFKFKSDLFSDGDYFDEILCYKDNSFGLLKFTSQDCEFSNPFSIDETTKQPEILVFPNPCQDMLHFKLPSTSKEQEVRLMNLLGNEIIPKLTLTKEQPELNLQALKSGIYFLELYQENSLIKTLKVVKE